MLTTFFPVAAQRYRALPVFGPLVDQFALWLWERGYSPHSVVYKIWSLRRMDRYFRRRKLFRSDKLTSSAFRQCWAMLHRLRPMEAATARAMEQFLGERGLLQGEKSPPLPSFFTAQLDAYGEYQRGVQGFSPLTIQNHRHTVDEFLSFVHADRTPGTLASLGVKQLDGFLKKTAARQSRATLQHTTAALRGYLRFLAVSGQHAPGLEQQIDTPRLYRFEQLPRSLSWSVVKTLLDGIPRRSPKGLRDYAMLYLIASYGLRSSEVVHLRLGDIDWRRRLLHIRQTKTCRGLDLPLTEQAGAVLIDYLRKAERPPNHRELFLRMRAPAGPLKPTAVANAFQAWVQHCGLAISFRGAHCLRHSYAVHLLQRGISLKAIGDLLGHRSAESTAAYIRLAAEDLREVCLPVPRTHGREGKTP